METTKYEVECYWRSSEGYRDPAYNGTKTFVVNYYDYGGFYSASCKGLGVGKDAKTPEGAIRSLCYDNRVSVENITKLEN